MAETLRIQCLHMTIPGGICCVAGGLKHLSKPAEPMQHQHQICPPRCPTRATLKYGHAGGSYGENRSSGGLHASSTRLRTSCREITCCKLHPPLPLKPLSLFDSNNNHQLYGVPNADIKLSKATVSFCAITLQTNPVLEEREEKRSEKKNHLIDITHHFGQSPSRHPALHMHTGPPTTLLHLHTSRCCQPWPCL